MSGLRWGSSYAVSGDASVILVGAAGRVLSGAVYGGQDRGIDGKVVVPTIILRGVAIEIYCSRSCLQQEATPQVLWGP